MTTTEHLDRIEAALRARMPYSGALESLRAIRQTFEMAESFRYNAEHALKLDHAEELAELERKANAGSPVTLPESSPDTHKSGVTQSSFLSCPFCGDLAWMHEDPRCFSGGGSGWRVECEGDCHSMTCWWHAKEQATSAWNRRTPMAQQPPSPDTDSPDARTQVEVLEGRIAEIEHQRAIEATEYTRLEAQAEEFTRIIERLGGRIAEMGRIMNAEADPGLAQIIRESTAKDERIAGLIGERDAAVESLAECSYRLLMRVANLEAAQADSPAPVSPSCSHGMLDAEGLCRSCGKDLRRRTTPFRSNERSIPVRTQEEIQQMLKIIRYLGHPEGARALEWVLGLYPPLAQLLPDNDAPPRGANTGDGR